MPVPTLARLVGGEWRAPEDGRTIDVTDPADVRHMVARVPAIRAEDVPGCTRRRWRAEDLDARRSRDRHPFQAGRSVADGCGRDRSAGMSAVAPAKAPAPAMTKVARGPVRATSGPAMR